MRSIPLIPKTQTYYFNNEMLELSIVKLAGMYVPWFDYSTYPLKTQKAIADVVARDLIYQDYGMESSKLAIVGLPTQGALIARNSCDSLGVEQYWIPFTKIKEPYRKEKMYSVEFKSVTTANRGLFFVLDRWVQYWKKNAMPVVIVDDVIATGGTLLAACQVLGMAGLHVAGIYTVFVESRNGEWRENLSRYDERIKYLYEMKSYQGDE